MTDQLSTTPAPDATVLQEMAAMRAELATLREQVARLQAAPDQPLQTTAAGEQLADDAPELVLTSRRRLFALAGGAAAAAAIAGTVGSAQPAAAAYNQVVQVGQNAVAGPGSVISTFFNYAAADDNDDTMHFLVAGDAAVALTPQAPIEPSAVAGYASAVLGTGVTGFSSRPSGNGVVGIADNANNTLSFGVWGRSAVGAAVVGESASGYDLYARGTGRVFMRSFVNVGPPSTGSFTYGEIVRDGQADLWICISGGASSKWRKLGGASTAGALHVIDPARVYDSRFPGGAGAITSGQDRAVGVANAYNVDTGVQTVANVVPAGATAVVGNLTIANATNGGYLAVTPGDAVALAASTINWSPGTTFLANGFTAKLDATRQLKVFAGGGGSAQFLVDITGYYL